MFISGATLVFNETTYSASEAGPLEVDVCVGISDLTGELQSDLIVTLSDLPGIATGMAPIRLQPFQCNTVCVFSHIVSVFSCDLYHTLS